MSDDTRGKFGAVKIVAIIVAVLVVALVALYLFVDVNQFKPELESKLTSALGRDIKMGDLSLSIFSGAVGVGDISIADDPSFSSVPFLRAKSLKVGVELIPLLLSKDLRITQVALESPSINLIRSSRGRWNFSSLGSGGNDGNSNSEEKGNDPEGGISGDDIAIGEIRISDGRITIDQGKGGKTSTYSDVNITAENLSFATSFPFTLSAALPGNGSLSLEGKAGPVNRADAAATPLEAEIKVKSFNLIESGFVSPEAGLSGIVDFDGVLTSDGRKMESKGSARAERLQVVQGGSPAGQAVSMDYAVDYNLDEQRGVLDSTKIHVGKAVADLSGSFQKSGKNLSMKMKLNGSGMPVDDIKSLLPAFGVVLPKGASLEGGVLNTNMTAEGPVDAMTITGSSDLSNSRLAGFDLAGKLAVLAKLAGINPESETQIETFASGVRVTNQGISVNDIRLIVPSLGELYGDGIVSPDQSLDFKMRALVKAAGGIGTALTRLTGGGGNSGKMTIPFFIQGTASEPKFVPDVKNAATSILGSQLSGQGGEEGEAPSTGKAIGDALKSLLGK
jgi:AsmA protein